MSVSRNDLDDALRDADDLLGCSVPYLEEGCNLLPVLFTLSTLTESVIAHGPDLPALVEHHEMVVSGCDHFERRHVLHEDRLIDDEVPSELRAGLPR